MVKEGLTALAVPLDEVNIIRMVMVVWMWLARVTTLIIITIFIPIIIPIIITMIITLIITQVGRLEWLSGFSGSNGQVVLTMDQALLWTDGRYHHDCDGDSLMMMVHHRSSLRSQLFQVFHTGS